MPTVVIPEKLEPIVNYVVQGTEHQFTFKFFVTRTEDLFVYVNNKLVDKNNYTVTGFDNPDGGYVDIIKNLQPLVKGDQVTLFRFTLPEQITEFIRLGDFTAVSVNAEFNRIYALMQELRRDAITKYDDDEQEVEGHIHFEDITFEYTGKPSSPVMLKDYKATVSALQAEDRRIESESKGRDNSLQQGILNNASDIQSLGVRLGANLPILPWEKGDKAINPYQRYMFTADKSSPAYGFTYNAPSASKRNPVVMGNTPVSDDDWHQWDLSTGKMRTDSASQIGYIYDRDYTVGMTIADGAMAAKLAIWSNGQFYSVGTDTRFTSVDFDADLASGKFVSAGLTTQMQQRRDIGYVKGWLNQHDDTLMIDAALSSGNGYIKLEAGRIYNVEGGVLYTRKWQVLDLNGGTIRLKDNAANRKTVLEQDDYSQIINGSVDGNWQSNNSGAQTWRKDGRLHVELSPESHGIAQRRYDTNSNVIRNAKGAFIDQVKVHDTLRSNILSCGSSSLGTVELENSYCDHQLYISGNGTGGQFGGHFEHIKIRGFCNSDALSVSSTGESTGLSFGKVSLRDITMTPWRSDSALDTDKYGSRWIECRENSHGTVVRSTITFDSIDIDDTRTELHLLYDNARKCRFRDWHVSIDSLTIRTQLCPASAVTADFQVLDVRNETTSVSIQNFHFEIDSPTPLSAEMAVVYAQNRSMINIGVITGKMIVEGIATMPRWIMNVDSTITVGSIGFVQNKGTVLWNRSVNYQSKITIGSDNGVLGYTEAIVNTSDNAAINPVINNVTGRSITLEGGVITNKPINGFLVGAIDLGLSSGVVGDIDNAYVGQKVEIIWNGACQKSGGNIKWLNKIEPTEIPAIGSFSILRYSKHNGMWVESSFAPF